MVLRTAACVLSCTGLCFECTSSMGSVLTVSCLGCARGWSHKAGGGAPGSSNVCRSRSDRSGTMCSHFGQSRHSSLSFLTCAGAGSAAHPCC